MKKTKHVLAFFLFSVVLTSAYAQPGWNWGDQVDVSKEKNALYTDYYKAGKFLEAVEPHNWIIENQPDLHVSVYQNGEKIYLNLASKEKDAATKEEYVQMGLELFDKRIQYFQKEGYVLNRKATFAYKFYNKNKEKYPFLYELLNNAFKVNGNKFSAGNLVAYMNTLYKYKKFGGGGDVISDEMVIDEYFKITDALSEQQSKLSGDRAKKFDTYKDQVDKLLIATVNVDCEFVETKLGPKLDEKEDVNLAKKIFQLLLTNKCTDSPLAVKAAEIVNKEQEDFTITKFIAQKYASSGDYDKAFENFDKAINLTEDNIKKADIHLSKARIHSSQKNKVEARKSARLSLAFDPTLKDAHTLIGDLYITSFEQCKGGESRVKDRSIFIAAYEQYRRAGNSEKMAKAKAQFPSIEEIFNEEYSEGQSISTGCWINETVKIERRPES